MPERKDQGSMTKSKVWICGGLLLIAAALCLTLYNFWDEKRAGDSAEKLLLQYQELQVKTSDSELEDSGDLKMPALEIDGSLYIGVLEIPSLGVTLPVMKEWSYAGLKQAPCRYQGSAFQEDMIIAGHNYRFHFGGLHNLKAGNEVVFTDVEDNRYEYQVTEVVCLEGSDVEGMEAGEWDLTLFTCTTDGQSRVTVRCTSVE